MKRIFLIMIILICSFHVNADPFIDSPGTWALWNMEILTNVVTDPKPPWHIPDDDSIYHGRDNDLILGSDKNVIVSGGVYGNALYFNGLNRYYSEKGWTNADIFSCEFEVKPLKFDVEQRLLEITSAISVRFQPNSGHTYGRIMFVVYDGGAAKIIYSNWLTASAFSNQWKHVTASVMANGDYRVTLEGTTDVTGSGLSGIDDAYSGDARYFVGGDRLGGNLFHGYIDELKIATIPEPFYSCPANAGVSFIVYCLFFINRKFITI